MCHFFGLAWTSRWFYVSNQKQTRFHFYLFSSWFSQIETNQFERENFDLESSWALTPSSIINYKWSTKLPLRTTFVCTITIVDYEFLGQISHNWTRKFLKLNLAIYLSKGGKISEWILNIFPWSLKRTKLPWTFYFEPWPLVDLCLIWKNQVRRTGFLVYFEIDFCRLKIKYRSKGGQG